MHVCMYVYYACITYVHAYVHVCMYVYVCMYVCMYNICMYVCMYVCMYTCVQSVSATLYLYFALASPMQNMGSEGCFNYYL